MKARFFLLVTAAAYATAGADPTKAGSDITIVIRRDTASAQPAVTVKITNQSAFPICIRIDALRNPYSYEMDLKMRTFKGRIIRYNEPGYIAEPLEGVIRLEPGKSVQGRTYIYPRFKLRNRGRPFPQGMAVKASFPYNHCDLPLRLQASSRWQPI